MNNDDWKREKRKQRRLEALGTNDPKCGCCGVTDWRCLELHHVADHGCDATTVIVCRNCHRGLSDDQRNQPPFDSDADPTLHAIGRFLLGLADMLSAILERLRSCGLALIERATFAGEVQ